MALSSAAILFDIHSWIPWLAPSLIFLIFHPKLSAYWAELCCRFPVISPKRSPEWLLPEYFSPNTKFHEWQISRMVSFPNSWKPEWKARKRLSGLHLSPNIIYNERGQLNIKYCRGRKTWSVHVHVLSDSFKSVGLHSSKLWLRK